MGVTIKDIARELGLDHSTVGYALSGKGTIKAETRQRVQEAAKRMGYVANRMAKDIRKQENSSIGLIIPSIVMGYSEFAQHVFRLAYDAGKNLQIAVSEFDAKLETASIRSFLEVRTSGILMKTQYRLWERVPDGHPLRIAAKNGTPVVNYGSKFADSPFRAAYADYHDIGSVIGEHLKAAGHERVAILLHQRAPIYRREHDLADGVAECLGSRFGADSVDIVILNDERLPHETPEALVPVNTHYRDQVNEFIEHGVGAAAEVVFRKAMGSPSPPTALVCQNDLLAIWVIRQALAQGLRIPEDLAVVACDRSFATSLSPTPLTTVHVPPLKMAQAAFSLLEDQLAGRRVNDIAVPAELRPAASSNS